MQRTFDKAVAYAQLTEEFLGVISGGIPWESALVSLIALLKERLPYVSWVGFYRGVGKDLWVGPYQGKLACLFIPAGKGVCGKSFRDGEVCIVEDVEKFEGHIACDTLSRSEIVLPVSLGGKVIGVLDLDSHALAAFDEQDGVGLAILLASISTSLA
jgi:GAF domain-containing protein